MPNAKNTTADDLPSWQDLIAGELKPADESLHSQIKSAPERLRSAPRGTLVSSNFGGFAEVLARSAILRGGKACQPAVAAIKPFLPRAIKEVKGKLDERRANLAVHVF